MRKYSVLIRLWTAIIAFAQGNLFAQDKQTDFTIVSYNVENLFHPSNDPHTLDDDFTPNGVRRWTYARYRQKLNQVSKAIAACSNPLLPALVGLVEVEDDSVLNDLTQTGVLRKAGYRYVRTQNPDRRGLNVALLYQRDRFRLLTHQSIHIETLDTRDILHVSGELPTGDILDIFVVHFPSRRMGTRATEPQRIQVASKLRELIDSIQSTRTNPYILAMGDFNAHPKDRPLQILTTDNVANTKIGNTTDHTTTTYGLKNLTERISASKIGTYKWDGDWEIIDHILVNNGLLDIDTSPLRIHANDIKVGNFPFLMERDTSRAGLRPKRTYHGYTYQRNGTSDHLPLVLHTHLHN